MILEGIVEVRFEVRVNANLVSPFFRNQSSGLNQPRW
jgi:hypothetical protein